MGEGGGKGAWIYVALDPRTLKVVYLEPFFVSDEGNTNAFLEHLVDIRAVAETCDHRWGLVVGGLLLLAGGGEDHLEDSPGRGEIGDRGVLRGVPQTKDQGLRPLFSPQRKAWTA